VHFGWQLAHFGCQKTPSGALKVAKWYQYATKLHDMPTLVIHYVKICQNIENSYSCPKFEIENDSISKFSSL